MVVMVMGEMPFSTILVFSKRFEGLVGRLTFIMMFFRRAWLWRSFVQ